MVMEKRVGFTLTQGQIEAACVAYVANRLQDDEAAVATVHINGMGADPQVVSCDIAVAKKRVRKPKGAPFP